MDLQSMVERFPGEYSVYAKNLETGDVAAVNEHTERPSASLIKVPIMAEIFRRVEEEHLNLDETLTLRAEDQVPGSGVLIDLTPGLRLPLRDLTTLMITVSDNTATNLLIDFVGVDSVNALMRRLGLHHTALERRLERIPVERPRANRTSAYDMTRLMELLARGELISVDVSRRMVRILERCQGPVSIASQASESDYIGALPDVRVAHKTGSLSQASHDSGIVALSSGIYVVTIMSQGAPESVLLKNIGRIGKDVLRQLSKRSR
ncbi:MAG: class A beta-lactamase-related serine hydrolase [Firmicutes bacterium]|nr:class A beta-lactamase-related serine hydrolase [Bacillota bacterium]